MRAPAQLALAALLASPLTACIGGGDDGGGGTWREIMGLENHLIWALRATPADDVVLVAAPATSISNQRLYRWDGTTLSPITATGHSSGSLLLSAGPDGEAYATVNTAAGTQLHRLADDTTAALGPAFTGSFEYLELDGTGGLVVADADDDTVRRSAPGGDTWTPVPQTPTGVQPIGWDTAYTDDGAAYSWGWLAGTSTFGVVRIEPDGGGVSMPITCDRAEFAFCSASGALLEGGGAFADALMIVANIFTGPHLYRIVGSELELVAAGPPDHPHMLSAFRDADGRAYLIAAEDNLVSPHQLYRLSGDHWEHVSELPSHGNATVTPDGTIFAGLGTVISSGGLWVLDR